MNVRRYITLQLVLLAIITTGKAQQYFFRNYSAESGLPFVQVFCLHEDQNGYLWSGGYGGLSRFDGKQFLNYNRRSGLIDHNVNAIMTDEQGMVFVGTNKGLSVLRDGKFTNYARKDGLATPFVTALCRGFHNSMYIGTTSGLYSFRKNEIRNVARLTGYQVNCLFNPDSNVIFIGTNSGLVMFGHNTFEVLNKNSGLASNKINCVTRFRNSLVLGTSEGLTMISLNDHKITNYRIENGLIDENITDVLNQHDEFLWVASMNGLLRFNGTRFEYYNIGSENNSNQVRCLTNSREGNVWIGTHSGLYRYRDNSFSTFDKGNKLATGYIFQVFRDREDALWVTTQNSGIYRLRNTELDHFDGRNGPGSQSVHSGLETSDGRIFFATSAGVDEFRNGKFHPLKLPDEFNGSHEVLFESRNGTLWIGGSNGVTSVTWKNGKALTRFHAITSRNEFNVYGFCEDKDGALYIGTYKGGLWRLRNDSMMNFSTALNLNEENFFTIRYLRNRIFAASLNGLLVVDLRNGKLDRITDLDGLSSELIYSLELTENNSTLWMGTNQGINRLNLERYLSNGKIEIRSFGLQEGFAGVECNNGIWEDKDGTLWFGTVSGLVRHQPKFFRENKVENRTIIQNIRLMNEDTLLRDSSELPSKFNSITFYYRGICLTNPEKVMYQKKLEGLDKEWSTAGPEDYIRYTHLQPGKYIFKVRSCNNEGKWNATPTTFSFRILPPFYLTWWFVILAITMIFAGIYLVFMIRVHNIKRKQKFELERKVEMSKIELKALRAQMNPHFVFNSLNAIQHYIFNTRSDEAVKYLNKFARLVRIILNNSEKPTVTVEEDLEALKLYLELEQMRFEGKFDYEIIVDSSVDPDYDIMPPLLMQPYVENAILHGLNPKPTKGRLLIRLVSENNFLICSIEDNGIGRVKSSEIPRIMPVKNHRSMGMKITEERLRILNEINNSQLSVSVIDLFDEKNEPAGTRVYLYVPLTG